MESVTSTSALVPELLGTLRELMATFFHLTATALYTLWMLLRMFMWIGYYLAPYSKQYARLLFQGIIVLWKCYNNISPKVRCLIGFTFVLVSAYFYGRRSGMFQRIFKQIRKTGNQIKKRLRHALENVSIFIENVYNFLTEAATTLLPVLAVVLPLRLYLPPELFRRIANATVFAAPTWCSVVALSRYYAFSHRHTENLLGNDSINTLNCGDKQKNINHKHRLSLSTPHSNVFLEDEKSIQQGHTHNRSRKTIAATNPSFDKFSANNNHRVVCSKKDFAKHESQERVAFQKQSDTTLYSTTVWLDYWIAASVFDLLYFIPVFTLSIVFRGPTSCATYFHLGYVDEPHLQTAVTQFTPWRPLTKFARNAACGTTSLVYDLFYSILLTFVLTRRHKRLVTARHWLEWLVNKVVCWITGFDLIASKELSKAKRKTLLFSHSNTPSSTGLLPAFWTTLRSHLPQPAILTLDLFLHIPQVLLLMAPPFILPIFTVILGTIYPVLASLRKLEYEDQVGQIYWLTYFTLRSVAEACLFRWLRGTLVWHWMPLTKHLDLLFVTLIQIMSVNPGWIVGNLYARTTQIKSRSKYDSDSAEHGEVKEHHPTEDQTSRSGSTILQHKSIDDSCLITQEYHCQKVDDQKNEVKQTLGKPLSKREYAYQSQPPNTNQNDVSTDSDKSLTKQSRSLRKSTFMPVQAIETSNSIPTMSKHAGQNIQISAATLKSPYCASKKLGGPKSRKLQDNCCPVIEISDDEEEKRPLLAEKQYK